MAQTPILPNQLPKAKNRVEWPILPGSANPLAIVESAFRRQKPTVVVVENQRALQQWEHAAKFYSKDREINISVMPDWECLPYDLFSPHQDIVSERLKVLASSKQFGNDIIIIGLNTLANRMCPTHYVLQRTLTLAVGSQIEPEDFRNTLMQAGYQNVSQVFSHGEVTFRGGIIDLFPMGCDAPLRIELFGDEIDTIRYFDPQSQISNEKISQVDFYPAREFPLDNDAIRAFRSRYREKFDGDPKKSVIYNDISNGIAPAGIEFYLPLFFSDTAHFFDYFDEETLWVFPHNVDVHYQTIWANIQARYQGTNWHDDRPSLEPEELYFTPKEQSDRINKLSRIVLAKDKNNIWNFPQIIELSINVHESEPYAPLANHIKNANHRILLVASSEGRAELLHNILRPYGISPIDIHSYIEFINSDIKLALTHGSLELGIKLPDPEIEIICEAQIYGEAPLQERKTSQQAKDPDAIIRSLAELNVGDPIVHDDHGIGRYHGLNNMNINGQNAEFMVLKYQNDDTLYVPVMQLDRVSRYLGGDAEHAPLNKLGTNQWEIARTKAKQRAYDMAIELLENEALRSSRKGISFHVPEKEYQDFCAQFAYQETPDQHRAIEDVLNDLKSDAPMDRLVCGDVGFGKTEVAMRAAFIAAWNEKQVAVLVPTTLLAQQHFENFSERFANTPLKVGLISRFQSQKETKATLEQLENGTLDIIIGTHKLIQKNIEFKRLGLIVLDEEQRFGVRQKEVLKSMRKDVDVLTLTATPIPRTLNLAMSGIRSISIIATPPKARLSVKTFISPYQNAVINEALSREIRRGGQAYIVHNRVETIRNFAEEIQEILPEARIDIAHGQMGERELERIMQRFHQQRSNVLVCTTIVENGIDNPNANTILINRADRFGLAQLHQLRGRVGRSHHQAYAYLLTPKDKALMTPTAHKRLEAIQAMDELGAGFALASQDLEIRGSGELLGENQSGSIDEVGFSQYTRYLRQAIESLNNDDEFSIEDFNDEIHGLDIEIGAIALIPEHYIFDVHTRLVMYKRLASARSTVEIHELEVEFGDRFGVLPDELKTLIDLTELKLHAQELGTKQIHFGKIGGSIAFHEDNKINPTKVLELIQNEPHRFKLVGSCEINVTAPVAEINQRIELIRQILKKLG